MHRPTRSLRRSLPPVLAAVLCAAALAAPARALALEPIFQFTGRGYGHGVGMSQWGAKGMADNGWSYRQILGHYFQGSWVATWTGTTTVHVNLDPNVPGSAAAYSRSSWTLAPAHGPLTRLVVNGTTAPTANAYRFQGSGSSLAVYDASSGVLWQTLSGTVAVTESDPGGGQPVLIKVVDGSGWGNAANRRYRTQLELTAAGGLVRLVNQLGVDGYVQGVIPLESGVDWGEATKAQAVAARGYALTSGGTLYCNTYSQVYGGFDVEHAASNAAASATYHEVVMARDPVTSSDVMVKTYFFSASGGHTENIENVWGSGAKPYYVGVDDPYEAQTTAHGHIWDEQPAYSAAVVYSKLALSGDIVPGTLSDPGAIQDIVVARRGVSGRVMSVEVRGATRTVTLSGDSFRGAMGWGDTWFYVTSFQWTSATMPLGGGTATASFRVSPPITGQFRGLIKDGSDTGVLLSAVNGSGSVTLSALGRYWVDGTVYSVGSPGSTAGDLRGSASLFRNAGTAYQLEVVPGSAPEVPVAAAITIRTSAASVLHYRPFVLSGVLTPGKVGDPCVVEVRKPGLARWSYSSARLCYSAAGADGANWWYRYTPKVHGTYTFRVRFAGDASRLSCMSPNTVAVRVR